MRVFLFAIMAAISACASAPGGNDIGARTASWQGASIDELVAVLGQPSSTTRRGTLVWQFDGPERRARSGRGRSSQSAETESLSVIQACSNCLPGQGMIRSADSQTVSEPRVCKYLGYVEDGKVAKLTILSDVGAHCDFDELPLRPAD